MSRDQEIYAHLKERHAKARRISSMMLSMKDKGVTVKRQTSCKSVLVMYVIELPWEISLIFQVPFSSAAAPGHHRQNQHFGDQDLHLGVEAVLRRFSQRSHHHHRATLGGWARPNAGSYPADGTCASSACGARNCSRSRSTSTTRRTWTRSSSRSRPEQTGQSVGRQVRGVGCLVQQGLYLLFISHSIA